MQTRHLGRQGLTVSAIGLGCMGMSEFYGASDQNLQVLEQVQAIAAEKQVIPSQLAIAGVLA